MGWKFCFGRAGACAGLALAATLMLSSGGTAVAQTYGFATLQPGTLNHTTANLTEKDIKPVMVPNVIRSADDFTSGAADAFYFAFGAPKVREVDVTVGGTRYLEINDTPGIAAARKISAFGYLSDIAPGPIFVGVEKPMKTYTIDNILFTHAKVPDDVVYKVIETMEANKAEMIAVAPNLREFSAAGLYKQYPFPIHPGALKYFKDKNIAAKAFQ